MDPIRIIAIIAAVSILLKLVIGVFWPKKRIEIARKILRHEIIVLELYVLIALIVAYYTFRSVTILEFAASMILTSSLVGMVLIRYDRSMEALVNSFPRTTEDVLRRQWFNLIIWLGIALWILKEAI